MIAYGNIAFDNRHPTEIADAFFTIITMYDSRFSHTAGTDTITVDSFDIVFSYDGAGGATMSMIDGRNFIDAGGTVDYTFMLLITDTVFYFLLKTQNVANTPVTSICWIKEEGVSYFGVAIQGSSNGQIESIAFANKTNGGRYYAIKKHAQFSLISNAIVLITTSIIGDNGGAFQVLDGLRSCSNVPFNTTVSINNVNYYAIGTNTLVRYT